jgi:homoserine O-succinyltransferase
MKLSLSNEIRYGDSLKAIIDWAKENVFSTIYSCLASHFALNHLYEIERTISEEKIFGVFDHEIKRYSTHALVQGMDDLITAPHSRWGNMIPSTLKTKGVDVLAENEQVGWLLASDENASNGFDIYLQGHPEYDKYDLHSEFLRDWENGQKMPKDYYDSNNPAAMPKMTWANDARALHSNWMGALYKHFSSDLS